MAPYFWTHLALFSDGKTKEETWYYYDDDDDDDEDRSKHVEVMKNVCENLILTSVRLLVLLYEIWNNFWIRPTWRICGSLDIPSINRYNFQDSIQPMTLTQRDALDVTSRLLVNG
jgi:hypothetical protein